MSGLGLDEQLRPLTSDPVHAALFCDIDGTLAPIVERPDEARVPQDACRLLSSLSHRYACVACVSGRRALDMRRLVGDPGIAYAGLHGAELLAPGQEQPRLAASFASWQPAVQGFTFAHAKQLQAVGIRVEDKGPITAFHWRGAANEEAALLYLGRVAKAAVSRGWPLAGAAKCLKYGRPWAWARGGPWASWSAPVGLGPHCTVVMTPPTSTPLRRSTRLLRMVASTQQCASEFARRRDRRKSFLAQISWSRESRVSGRCWSRLLA